MGKGFRRTTFEGDGRPPAAAGGPGGSGDGRRRPAHRRPLGTGGDGPGPERRPGRGDPHSAGRASTPRFEADHAFANPSSGRYDAEAAEEAWRQVRDFLEGTLKSPS
ncbi:MAG TPA: dienelactone hydrolase family protein [Polyangiaceae bacterium LLY-WYZ-14_1]|nr:dienelactone hydrolase family protein [Polyangiaceae bacterium LLY-WYZ-14_1]